MSSCASMGPARRNHSLLLSAVWGALLAGFARWRGVAPRTAMLLALLVMSHWLLDVITHAPDMPLAPGVSPRFGLGLWNSIAGTLVIEGAMWIAGIWLYLAPRRATGWVGPAALWSFILVCILMWASGPWSPLPETERAATS